MQYTTAAIFGAEGLLANHLSHFECRKEQAAMADMVNEVLNSREHGIIEAGTGVGKSLAYLVPSLFWAVAQKKRVVIATHTLNLQEQLFAKDIPLLQQALPFAFSAELFKGRHNYLCKRRFYELNQTHSQQGLVPYLERLNNWSTITTTGDRSDCPTPVPNAVWSDIRCEKENCPEEACGFFKECFYWQLRHKLSKTEIIVTNHAMLLADIVTEGNLLPKYDSVVIDESHNLEDVATNAFSKELSRTAITAYYRTGLQLCNTCKYHETLELTEVRAQLDELMSEANTFFNEIKPLLSGKSRPFTASDIADPGFRKRLRKVLSSLEELEDFEEGSEIAMLISQYKEYTRQVMEDCALILAASDSDYVFWMEPQLGDATLCAAPLSVADFLKEKFFAQIPSVVLTSATLSTNGNFEYFKSRVGLDDCAELLLGSPFAFENQAVLCVPKLAPDPRKTNYEWYLAYLLLHTIAAVKGQVLALFTSYQTMQNVADYIYDKLEEEGYTLLVQGDDSRQKLVETFRATPRAVLLGTNSFWEGVDIPGDSLRAVVITRLPFTVPDRPVVAARLRAIDQEGGNSFQEYSIPQAILRLKQGFGRLIRTSKDRGGVVVLDKRILTAPYGKMFIDSLPPARFSQSFDDLREMFADLGSPVMNTPAKKEKQAKL